MFADLDLLTREQGVGIDNIQSHIASTKLQMKEANTDLKQAQQYQKDATCVIA